MQLTIQNKTCATPNPGGQSAFVNDWDHHILGLEGGWMSGKTWAGVRKLLSLHIYNAFDLVTGEPTYIPSVIVAPSYSNAMDFDIPELQKALEECNISYYWKASGSVSGGVYSAPAMILTDLGTEKNPSAILIRSAENPDRITGWQVGAALGDEPARWREDYINPRKDAMVQLLGRVRHPKANKIQALFVYTNEGDSTRVYEMMHDGKEDVALYRAGTKENPSAQPFYELQKKLLNKELVKQYLGGEAISLRGGRVYSSFSKDLHINSKLKIIEHLPIHLSLDFNIAPGMHGEVGQYLPSEDKMIVLHEFHALRMTVRDLMEEFLTYLKNNNLLGCEIHIYGDATGKAKSAQSGESCYDIVIAYLQRVDINYQMKVGLSNPRIVDRINTFETALYDIEGKVHWQCHPSCEKLIDDMIKMKRNKLGEIDTANPFLSHASDAEGYRVYRIRPIRRIEIVGDSRFSV